MDTVKYLYKFCKVKVSKIFEIKYKTGSFSHNGTYQCVVVQVLDLCVMMFKAFSTDPAARLFIYVVMSPRPKFYLVG
jgi:hypothetical protein